MSGGKIVLVFLVCGFLGYLVGYIVYCVLKVVVDGIIKVFGCEFGEDNIMVNVIVLIVFCFLLIVWMFEDDDKVIGFCNGFFVWVLKGCLGELEDLIGFLLFFVFCVFDFYIGYIFYVDGGYMVG